MANRNAQRGAGAAHYGGLPSSSHRLDQQHRPRLRPATRQPSLRLCRCRSSSRWRSFKIRHRLGDCTLRLRPKDEIVTPRARGTLLPHLARLCHRWRAASGAGLLSREHNCRVQYPLDQTRIVSRQTAIRHQSHRPNRAR